MTTFKVGDKVKIKASIPRCDLIATGLATLQDCGIVMITGVDSSPWDDSGVSPYSGDTTYITGPVGFCVPESFLEMTEKSVPSPQERLDALAAYFTSGNDVPVSIASIKAKDFWKIYNGDLT